MKKTLSLVLVLGLGGFAAASTAQDMEDPTNSADRYKRMFNQLDTDGSNTLSKEEAEPAGLSEEDFNHLDTNGDGELDLDEFLAVVPDSQ